MNLQNIQTVHAVQNQKNEQPNQKMGGTLKQILLQRRHIDGQEAQEKMVNTANYQRNANQKLQ